MIVNTFSEIEKSYRMVVNRQISVLKAAVDAFNKGKKEETYKKTVSMGLLKAFAALESIDKFEGIAAKRLYHKELFEAKQILEPH